MAADFPARLFKDGSPSAAMWPFLGFAACVLLVVTALIAIGRPDFALGAAWAAIVTEGALAITRKVRLKVPFGLVLTFYGPVAILAVAGLRAVF